jgi:hypothetical protein
MMAPIVSVNVETFDSHSPPDSSVLSTHQQQIPSSSSRASSMSPETTHAKRNRPVSPVHEDMAGVHSSNTVNSNDNLTMKNDTTSTEPSMTTVAKTVPTLAYPSSPTASSVGMHPPFAELHEDSGGSNTSNITQLAVMESILHVQNAFFFDLKPFFVNELFLERLLLLTKRYVH